MVRLTALKLFAVELSVIDASVAVEAFGLTVSVALFVAVRSTVAPLDVRPTCATALLVPTTRRAAAPANAFLNMGCIAPLRG